MRLREKTALVTGAGRGIGRAIALGLAREGARVVVADILQGNASAVANEINSAGSEAAAAGVDVTKRPEVEAAVKLALDRFGAIDILVNNVGWDKFAFFLDSEEETWDRIIAINYKSLLYVCKAALPHMKARGGRVINIASDAGRTGSSGEAVYSGTKGAIIAFSKALAREMVRYGITVNAVCPGLIETPLLQRRVRARQEGHGRRDAGHAHGPDRNARGSGRSRGVLRPARRRLHHRPNAQRQRRADHELRRTVYG